MDEKQPIIDHLNGVLGDAGPFVELKAPFNTSVWMKKTDQSEAKWKNKALMSGMEFQLTSVRAGAKDVLFMLTPVDEQEFEFAEIGSKKVFAAFPDLETQLVKLFPDEFRRSTYASTAKVFGSSRAKAIAEETEKNTDARYSDNPLWGSL